MVGTFFLPWEDLRGFFITYRRADERVVPRATGAECSSRSNCWGLTVLTAAHGKHRCRTSLAGESGIGSNE
jgi:hypothetical protein